MKKAITVTFIFLLLSATIAFQSFTKVEGETQDSGFVIKTTVTYSNPSNGTRIWNLTEEDRTIGLFMNNTWQTVQLTNHSYGLETTTVDEDGNPIAVLNFPKSELQPGENINYTVTYHALSKPRSLPNINEADSETLEDIPNDLKDMYSGAEGPWLVNNSELQDLAKNIAENETKVLTIVKNFIAWIKSSEGITYKTHEVPYYANQTLADRQGDCDDQAILLITLCRIYGIPAYLQIGCIYLPTYFDDSEYWEGHVRSVLKRVEWHGWAMVYVPPWRWLPVDLTYILGGNGDPLNSIKKAAVTSQKTLQYMNISQMDYVASSRTYRDFLKNNDFYVYAEDEMTQTLPESLLDGTIEKLFPWILATAIVAVAVVIAGIFMYIRKEKRLKETEFKLNSNYGS